MKSKLELLTKINSLILIVVFTIVLLPTCKQNDTIPHADPPQKLERTSTSDARSQIIHPLTIAARYLRLK